MLSRVLLSASLMLPTSIVRAESLTTDQMKSEANQAIERQVEGDVTALAESFKTLSLTQKANAIKDLERDLTNLRLEVEREFIAINSYEVVSDDDRRLSLAPETFKRGALALAGSLAIGVVGGHYNERISPYPAAGKYKATIAAGYVSIFGILASGFAIIYSAKLSAKRVEITEGEARKLLWGLRVTQAKLSALTAKYNAIDEALRK